MTRQMGLHSHAVFVRSTGEMITANCNAILYFPIPPLRTLVLSATLRGIFQKWGYLRRPFYMCKLNSVKRYDSSCCVMFVVCFLIASSSLSWLHPHVDIRSPPLPVSFSLSRSLLLSSPSNSKRGLPSKMSPYTSPQFDVEEILSLPAFSKWR